MQHTRRIQARNDSGTPRELWRERPSRIHPRPLFARFEAGLVSVKLGSKAEPTHASDASATPATIDGYLATSARWFAISEWLTVADQPVALYAAVV